MTGNAIEMPRPKFASYSDIAGEYYNSAMHPTCASLRELSCQYLVPRLTHHAGREQLLEVGAGRSIAAPLWDKLRRNVHHITLLDSSIEMLAYSAKWRSRGVSLVIADAQNTGLQAESVDLVVASLGDPYNTAEFWSEVARLLRPGGRCLFTTPALEWASTFRPLETRSAAEFVRADGTVLLMPSPILNEVEQIELFTNAGLKLIETEAFSIADLRSAAAPKLLCVSSHEPILRGYTVER